MFPCPLYHIPEQCHESLCKMRAWWRETSLVPQYPIFGTLHACPPRCNNESYNLSPRWIWNRACNYLLDSQVVVFTRIFVKAGGTCSPSFTGRNEIHQKKPGKNTSSSIRRQWHGGKTGQRIHRNIDHRLWRYCMYACSSESHCILMYPVVLHVLCIERGYSIVFPDFIIINHITLCTKTSNNFIMFCSVKHFLLISTIYISIYYCFWSSRFKNKSIKVNFIIII